MIKWLTILMFQLCVALPSSAKTIKLSKVWHLRAPQKAYSMQTYLNGAGITRYVHKKDKGVFILQDYQKMNSKKVKRIMQAAKIPVNSLKHSKRGKVHTYAFPMNNSIIWFSNRGGRITATFDSVSPRLFNQMTKNMRRF